MMCKKTIYLTLKRLIENLRHSLFRFQLLMATTLNNYLQTLICNVLSTNNDLFLH